MVKVFKWWWAWNFEEIENWLESMEMGGMRLVKTRHKGTLFYFEKCNSTKARYCVEFQPKITPEYITLINDDGWDIYQLGMGWYMLRKEYTVERPNFYSDFEGLIKRNKYLLALMVSALLIEILCFVKLISSVLMCPSNWLIAEVALLGGFVISFFAFTITNIALQIKKFSRYR